MNSKPLLFRTATPARVEPLEARIAPAFGAVFDLASLTSLLGGRLVGAAAGDSAGLSVAGAGDVNNDGIADYLVGAPFADDSGTDSGAAYVLFGKAGGLPPSLVLPPASAADGFKITGAAAGDFFGTSVSAAGDVNNDGFDDILVGAPNADNKGAAYVVFGASTPPLALNVSTLTGSNGFKLAGDGGGQQFGISVSRIGDLQGDGFDDFIVGAPGDDTYGTDAGAAYIIYGGSTFAGTVAVSSLGAGGAKLMGDTLFDMLGSSVSAAGDVNNDAEPDFIVGSPGADSNGTDSGSAYVLFGGTTLPNFFAATTVGGSLGFEIRGVAAGNLAGRAVSGGGDLNGDGFAELLVGAPNPDGSGLAGSVAVVFGSNSISSPVEISGLTGGNGFTIPGTGTADRFGLSVSAAGDVNGDGFADIVAAAYRANGAAGSQSGAGYVIYGRSSAFASTFDLTTLDGTNGFRIDAAAAGDLVGRSVSAVGDVDGDGLDDLLVGAPGVSAGGASAGAAYVIFGQPMTDIDVSVVGGSVVIDDTLGADSDASLTITRNGGFVRISDANATLRALAGVTQIDANTVEIPLPAITGIIAINGGNGDDSLLLDFTTGDLSATGVGFVAGPGTDAITLQGPAPSFVLLGVTSSAGAMTFDSTSVTFDGTESVTDLRAAGSRIFTATDDTGYAIDVQDHGSGITDITSSPGLLYRFASPAGLLSILGHDGADTIQILSYDAMPTSQLIIDGGSGSDTVNIAAALVLGQIDINSEVINPLRSLTLGPSAGNSISTGGTLSFASGSTLGLVVDGDPSFINSTTINVVGSVNINGVSLRLDGFVSGPVSRPVLLLNNDGVDPIAGTFNRLPEGAGVILGTVPYVISYVGGDGNDVILTRRIAFGSSLLGDLDGTDGTVILSAGADEQLGSAVSMLGDVNGDGFDDFAVTAPRGPLSFQADLDGGFSYVIFGAGTPFPASIPVGSLDGTNGFVIRGVSGGDFSGASVSGGGDINGDGFGDIVIGATFADPDTGVPGAVYTIFGSSTGFAPIVELSALDGTTGFRFDGVGDGDLFGASVNAAGDVNGDGITDLIVGAPYAGATNEGRAYVLFGSRQPFAAVVSTSSLNGTNGFAIDAQPNPSGDFGRAQFGSAVGAVDINGDGFDDVIVGAPSFTPAGDVYGALKGAAYVIFGAATQKNAVTDAGALNGKNGFRILGERPYSSLGLAVSRAGDFNDDGIDDLIVGAPGRPGVSVFEQPGSAFIVFGKATGWVPTVDVAGLTGRNGLEIVGAANTDATGTSVGAVGDFNGDGISDVIVGSPESDASGQNKGAAHVIFGRRGAIAPEINVANINGTNGYSYLGSESGERAGTSVAGVGDINRDGLADIAVGSPLYGDDGSIDGRAYVVFGKAGVRPMPRVLAGGTSAAFDDVDGDEIIVRVTGGKVNADMFTFSADGDLLFVDLNAGGTIKRGANLTFLVNPRGGDGLLNVGAISGVDLNLGKISVTGDLGQIDITPRDPLKPALKQLIVGSLGMMGADNQMPGTVDPLVSDIEGSVTRVLVKRNIEFASLFIDGALGNITINGEFNGLGALTPAQLASLGLLTSNVAGGGTLANSGLSAGSIGQLNIKQSLNNAAVQSGGNIGSASVGGSVNRGAIVAGGKIGVVKVVNSITSDDPSSPSVIAARGRLNPANAAAAVAINTFIVRGDVTNSEILIGYDSSFNAVNPDAGLGKLTVRGNWTASSLTAGIEDGGDDGFGRNDTVIPETEVDTILSRIASVVILGTVAGTSSAGDSFAITAERISKVKTGSTIQPLDKLLFDDILVEGTTNFRIKEVARL